VLAFQKEKPLKAETMPIAAPLYSDSSA